MNRDEQRQRREWNSLITLDDSVSHISRCYPVDEISKGTWFGINSRGLVAGLLNRYQDVCITGSSSRGLIIPQLLQQGTWQNATKFMYHLDCTQFQPFDLILIGQGNSQCYHWNGSALKITAIDLTQPWFISSSSERLHEVISYRRELFDKFRHAYPMPELYSETILNKLHLLYDSSRPADSIYMRRDHAHTKSLSQVTVRKNRLQYYYLDETALINYTPHNPWRMASKQRMLLL